MNRFRFTKKLYLSIGRYLDKKNKIKPKILTTYAIKKTKQGLYYQNKKIIVEDDKNLTLRKVFYGLTAPAGRDSLYNYIKGTFWGISNRDCLNFLNAQFSVQMLRPKPPKDKMVGTVTWSWKEKSSDAKPMNQGLVGVDLVTVGQHCLPENFQTELYLLVMVHPMTNYPFAIELENKEAPTTLEGFRVLETEFRKKFGYGITTIQSDRGGEFKAEFKKYVEAKKIRKQFLSLVSYVESANSKLQRQFVLHGTGARQETSMKKLLPLSLERMRNTIYRRFGKTPKQMVKILKNDKSPHKKVFLKFWNSKRAKHSIPKVKNRLEKGDLVRFYQGTGKETLYKRYNGLVGHRSKTYGKVKQRKGEKKISAAPTPHWSEEVYTVVAVRIVNGRLFVKLNKNPFSAFDKIRLSEYAENVKIKPEQIRKKFLPSMLFQKIQAVDEYSRTLVTKRIQRNKQQDARDIQQIDRQIIAQVGRRYGLRSQKRT